MTNSRFPEGIPHRHLEAVNRSEGVQEIAMLLIRPSAEQVNDYQFQLRFGQAAVTRRVVHQIGYIA